MKRSEEDVRHRCLHTCLRRPFCINFLPLASSDRRALISGTHKPTLTSYQVIRTPSTRFSRSGVRLIRLWSIGLARIARGKRKKTLQMIDKCMSNEDKRGRRSRYGSTVKEFCDYEGALLLACKLGWIFFSPSTRPIIYPGNLHLDRITTGGHRTLFGGIAEPPSDVVRCG